jgi:hypothetical protein
MANVKISALPAATTPLAGTETIPIVQGGITAQTTVSDIVNSVDIISNVSISTAAGALPGTTYTYLATNAITITLPTAVGNTSIYNIVNVGSNTVTIATTSSQTINGSTSVTLPISGMSLSIVSNNANWRIF